MKNGKLGKKDMKELASKNRKLSWEQSKSTQKRVPEQDQELERLSSQKEDKTGLGEGLVVHQQEGVEDGRVVHTEPAGHPGPEQSVQLDAEVSSHVDQEEIMLLTKSFQRGQSNYKLKLIESYKKSSNATKKYNKKQNQIKTIR